jgi:mannose-6-phosphate isomerase-like protein (cupin superfamily)
MRIVQKPWGYEEIWAEASSYVGKILSINPGHKLSRQYHNLKEESFRVLEGTLTLEIGSGEDMITLFLKEGACYHCPPKTIHRMINDSSMNYLPVKVLEVSTNHLDDVIRLEDDYKR